MHRLNLLEATRFEKLPVTVYRDKETAAVQMAARIAALIRSKQARGEQAVLGLATGATPVGVYEELVHLHREEGLSFRNVVTFNLDEYYPMQPMSPQSYVTFMNEHLFDHLDIERANIHIPDGTLAPMRWRPSASTTSGRLRRPAASTYSCWALGAPGTRASTSPARPPTRARAW
ncbi:6-phosphogluconolactonase [Hymenobacter sp. H14-R3]|uniref:6-phosphogluconolactonase n=1 Tax=Hymenobacter sp. H14-R3 TaxID=3046308 RepID=UPI0032D95A7C